MSWTHWILRRTHLYLGLFLLPWVWVYGVSSLILNHGPWVRAHFGPEAPRWRMLWTRPYAIDLPARTSPERLRELGRKILADQGLEGAFWISRQGRNLSLHLPHFWRPLRLRYDGAARRLTAEQQRFTWPDLFVRMHVRGGYQQSNFFDDAWAVVVDFTCLAILLWVGSGIYLWWKLPQTRWWGALALAAGLGAFVALVLML